jgi:hypothetical protein
VGVNTTPHQKQILSVSAPHHIAEQNSLFYPHEAQTLITQKCVGLILYTYTCLQWRTQDFFFWGGGFKPGIFSGGQQIQLKIEGRENGDLGAVAP